MGEANIVKKYSNGEVTIVWKPGHCIHSAICWKQPNGLDKVFNPNKRPWIKPDGASTEEIIKQVKKCPSGALGYVMDTENNKNIIADKASTLIELVPNGPYMVTGQYCVVDALGNEKAKNETIALCRCGASGNKPFCDGSHVSKGFTE